MKLQYETGTATLIHFLVMMLFSFVGGVASIISDCHDNGASACIEGSVTTFVYVILLAAWFGFLATLGYAAQDKRSHKLAYMLMAAEFLVLGIALFNAKHFPNLLGLITSLVDAAFAAWIIVLAFRLSRAKGGRIMPKSAQRARRRPQRRAS